MIGIRSRDSPTAWDGLSERRAINWGKHWICHSNRNGRCVSLGNLQRCGVSADRNKPVAYRSPLAKSLFLLLYCLVSVATSQYQ